MTQRHARRRQTNQRLLSCRQICKFNRRCTRNHVRNQPTPGPAFTGRPPSAARRLPKTMWVISHWAHLWRCAFFIAASRAIACSSTHDYNIHCEQADADEQLAPFQRAITTVGPVCRPQILHLLLTPAVVATTSARLHDSRALSALTMRNTREVVQQLSPG